MGPRLVDRGESGSSPSWRCRFGVLQWGRGWLTAESRSGASTCTGGTTASMGPRLVDRGEKATPEASQRLPMLQWGRGWLTAESVARAAAVAS